MDEDVRESAIDHIRTQVGRGSRTFVEVVDDTVEYLGDEAEPGELRPVAWSIASDEFAAALAAQATWPERTDNDRLTEAFRALDAAGIVARQDFACCQNCGLAEIGGTVPDPAAARGYVFYHQQDTDSAVAGEGVHLAYGLFGAPPTTEIGTEVTTALTAAGLPVNWDGTTGQRIHVPLDWAIRRHGRLAAFAAAPEPLPDVDMEVAEGGQYFAAEGTTSAELLALLELPWLPAEVRLRIEPLSLDVDRTPIFVHREFDRLVTDDGRVAGRFDGLRLLRREPVAEPVDEPDLLETRYDDGTYHHDRPMRLAEALDVLRGMPLGNTWFCAQARSRAIVQLNWPGGRLWVESPNAAEQTTTGAHASRADAERMLAVLATEGRAAVDELPGVGTQPW
ncbi:DUF6891 domain-containing protein [Cryptosporangium sp. NPDC048952]|uniref:DUF6891 domain-containing protein n=1 Tax=Cryptosporangium sp. NPDC048952 TaxID=3363961 RepID=UPI0037101792